MGFLKSWVGAACVVAASFLQAGPTLAGSAAAPVQVSSLASQVPAMAASLARQVLAEGDHDGRPFAIVDKKAAMLMVYQGDGTLVGVTPALIGRTPGDHSVPGVGERTQTGTLRAADLTTAAGRFQSEPGRNHTGENVVWLDYQNALAIHRVRPGAAHGQRLTALASPDPQARRLSSGCVVVSVAFYEKVVQPLLGRNRGVVYVMPELASIEASPVLKVSRPVRGAKGSGST